MRRLPVLVLLAAALPAAAGAQGAPRLVADSVPPSVDVPADIRGLVPGQRVHVRAFQGSCKVATVVYGTVNGWAGDTMTVDLEPRGTILPGDQLAFPVATIQQLHLSLGRPATRPSSWFARLRTPGERWVELKRPRGVAFVPSCPAPVPPDRLVDR